MTIVTVYNNDTAAELSFMFNGVKYYKVDMAKGIKPYLFTTFALKADRDLSEEEFKHVAGIVGYYWKTVLKARMPLSEWSVKDRRTIVFHDGLYTDSGFLLSNSSHIQNRIAEFVQDLNLYLDEGTTERQDGTRLLEGFDIPFNVEFLVNSVCEQVTEEERNSLRWLNSDSTQKNETEAEKPATETALANIHLLERHAEDLSFKEVRELMELARALHAENKSLRAENNVLNQIRQLLVK